MEDLIERARAIEIIHELQDSQTFDQTADMAYDLVDWAISEIPSAQPEPTTHGSIYAETAEKQGDRTTDGMISRHDAYKTLTEYYHHTTEIQHKALREALERVPSAQPDSKELSFTQKKLDTISRQAAIRWVKTECNPYGKPTLDFESGKKVIEHLKQMPSAQPEPCGDVVSRNAIVQKLNEMDRYVSTELRLCDTDKKFPQNEVFIVDDVYEEIVEQLPSAQPETHEERTETHGVCLDTIDRQAAIDHLKKRLYETALNNMSGDDELYSEIADNRIHVWVNEIPSAHPEPCNDADKLKRCKFEYINACKIVACPTPDTNKSDIYDAYAVIKALHPIFGDEEF